MSLSNYERKVLEEFEAEFEAVARRGRARSAVRGTCAVPVRVRTSVWRRRGPLAVALLGIGACVMLIALVPQPAAAILAALTGAAAGCVVTMLWRRTPGGAVPRRHCS